MSLVISQSPTIQHSMVTPQLAVTHSLTVELYRHCIFDHSEGGKKLPCLWPQILTPIKTHQCAKSQGNTPTVKCLTHTKTLQKHKRMHQIQDRLHTLFCSYNYISVFTLHVACACMCTWCVYLSAYLYGCWYLCVFFSQPTHPVSLWP